jgi:hypothetical protein
VTAPGPTTTVLGRQQPCQPDDHSAVHDDGDATVQQPRGTSSRRGGPITITVGGTYSGCYQSTVTGTPAVTLATAAAVTLDHATVIAKGFGLQDTVTGTRLTVRNSTFTQTNPGAVVGHRAVELDAPASFVFEHNSLTDTDGIYLQNSTWSAPDFRFNLTTNVGPTASDRG